MQIAKQIAIFLENRPGMLARVCDALAEAKINIYAITTSDTVDHSVIRMVVSDPRRALLLFEEHGTLVVEDDVLISPARWHRSPIDLRPPKSTLSIATRRPARTQKRAC